MNKMCKAPNEFRPQLLKVSKYWDSYNSYFLKGVKIQNKIISAWTIFIDKTKLTKA